MEGLQWSVLLWSIVLDMDFGVKYAIVPERQGGCVKVW
jgi:hypothetical protein